jgi:hypothetical protein
MAWRAKVRQTALSSAPETEKHWGQEIYLETVRGRRWAMHSGFRTQGAKEQGLTRDSGLAKAPETEKHWGQEKQLDDGPLLGSAVGLLDPGWEGGRLGEILSGSEGSLDGSELAEGRLLGSSEGEDDGCLLGSDRVKVNMMGLDSDRAKAKTMGLDSDRVKVFGMD